MNGGGKSRGADIQDETKEMPVNHKEKRLQTNLKKTLLYKMTTKNTHIDKLCYCIDVGYVLCYYVVSIKICGCFFTFLWKT